jgi:glyoxylase-like metal-dependent hydrolase (beta-lactamase superfamily II)
MARNSQSAPRIRRLKASNDTLRSRLKLVLGLLAGVSLWSQTPPAPQPPFTAKQAEQGRQLAATSLEVRKQITSMRAPAEPFKIMGNLYFVGVANGESYLLTSPQGHILFGASFADTTAQIEKNIEAVGFKVSDIKAILLNHYHGDQSGGAAAFKQKTGAAVMAGFAEVPYLEHGGSLPSGPPIPPVPGPAGAPAGQVVAGVNQYPPVKVDRALFDGDVIKVGPLTVTAYLAPGHSPSSTSWLYTVREGGKNLRVFEFCCWEYPDDLSRNAYITEASVRHTFELFRKVLPVDIYLETGSYGWSGTLNQPSGTITERMAKLKTDNKLFVNREIFPALSAAREVEFEEKLAKLKASNPAYK